MKTQKFQITAILLLSLILFGSCKKLIEIESPKNQLTTDKVFSDTSSATAALLNIYVILENQQYSNANRFLSNYTDESTSINYQGWNQSRIPANDISNKANWQSLYSAIYQCNLILEQKQNSMQLPVDFIKRIRSEATFLRAYAYFNLINIYGKIPLITSTNVNANRQAVQQDSTAVYKMIIEDLNMCRTSLNGVSKTRSNKNAATALLSRIYLMQRNWNMAENLATELINSGNYTPLEVLSNVFKASSKESILQFATQTGFVTETPSIIPSNTSFAPNFFFTTEFLQSFEPADLRQSTWIATNTVTQNNLPVVYSYPAKYKNRIPNTGQAENLVILRIAEQYLIRAEARAYIGKYNGVNSVETDLNTVRTRAGLTDVHPTNLQTALQFIELERRHELFFENSSRFLDLKRTGKIQSVMSLTKPTWIKTAALLPIPNSEIIFNSKFIQNEGY